MENTNGQDTTPITDDKKIRQMILELSGIDANDPRDIEGLAGFKVLYDLGGDEGDGEVRQQILEIEFKGTQYIIGMDGFYESYYGTDWSKEWYFAEPYIFSETRYKQKE